MKNFQLADVGLQELSMEEQQEITGGFGLLMLAVLGGLVASYNLGKAVGNEAYLLSR